MQELLPEKPSDLFPARHPLSQASGIPALGLCVACRVGSRLLGAQQGSSTQSLAHSQPHTHPREVQLDGEIEASFAGQGNEATLLLPS